MKKKLSENEKTTLESACGTLSTAQVAVLETFNAKGALMGAGKPVGKTINYPMVLNDNGKMVFCIDKDGYRLTVKRRQ